MARSGTRAGLQQPETRFRRLQPKGILAPKSERTIERMNVATEGQYGARALAAWANPSNRHVVVHYHFFKNAGTSVDESLKAVFGDRCIGVEDDGGLSPAALADFIAAHPNHRVFSSHTAQFPVPQIDGVAILPIVFVRHPIDRIRSVYEFERRDPRNSPAPFRMAKELGLKDYVSWRLNEDRQIRDFHVTRFARGLTGPASLATAQKYIRRLPFVGVVDRFEASLTALSQILKQSFSEADLKTRHSNVTQDTGLTIKQRVIEIRNALGPALYGEVLRQNHADIVLYRRIAARYPLAQRAQSPGHSETTSQCTDAD
jgi:hypothetical protein